MSLQDTLNDLRVALYRGQSLGLRHDIGLGRRELHPLAFHLNRKTNDEIFGTVDFQHNYRGVRSPQLDKVLSSYFEAGEGGGLEVLEKDEHSVPESDHYFRLVDYDDFNAARDQMDAYSGESLDHVDAAVETLVHDRLAFIKHENARMLDRVAPYDVSLPDSPRDRR